MGRDLVSSLVFHQPDSHFGCCEERLSNFNIILYPEEDPGFLHEYTAVLNRPTDYYDPDGLSPTYSSSRQTSKDEKCDYLAGVYDPTKKRLCYNRCLTACYQSHERTPVGTFMAYCFRTCDKGCSCGLALAELSADLSKCALKKNPALAEKILVLNAEMPAGFHCNAPLRSIGCAVAAPPIDILAAPIPCII